MIEKEVERKLIDEVKKRGGICEKWNSGTIGWPDRICLFPDGIIGFIEVKRPNGKARPLQVHRHKLLKSLGFKVYVVDRKENIGDILNEIQSS